MSFSSLPLYIVHISGPKKIFLKEKKKEAESFSTFGREEKWVVASCAPHEA